jgi:hypothetical protein
VNSIDPTDPHDRCREKVQAFFRALGGARQLELDASKPASPTPIASVLSETHGWPRALDIAFHLTDWNADAAFLVALAIAPERFDKEEIEAGISAFILHAPNHVAAAAKLAGFPITDVFGVGPLVESD